jgi:Dyp-type peroxidase family
MRSTLDLDDIQGLAVRGFGSLHHARHLFSRVQNPAAARKFLARIADELTSAACARPPVSVSVALSYRGLQALELPTDALHSFPEAFRAGMRERARGALHEATSSWEALFCDPVHVWVAVQAATPELLEARCNALREQMGDGLREPHEQHARALFDDRRRARRVEHFGFADAISNPVIAGFAVEPRRGNTTLAAGEILLGHRDAAGRLPEAPRPIELADNGTFVVFKKLHQHVAAFWSYVESAAEALGRHPTFIAAKMFGRWPDGTPLAPLGEPARQGRRAAQAAAAGLQPGSPDDNGFCYKHDEGGSGCPLHAHIRRMHPRTAAELSGFVERHRILRRGMSYGEPLPRGSRDDGAERGLLFIGLCASIERQYEFIQRRAARGDPIVGDRAALTEMVIPGDAEQQRMPLICTALPRFVESRGGEYFFMPGRHALHAIAHERFSREASRESQTCLHPTKASTA